MCVQRSSRPGPASPRRVSLRPPSRKTRPTRVMTARTYNPSPVEPPSQEAGSMRAPRKSEKSGIHHLLCHHGLRAVVCMEYLLYPLVEESGKRDRERQRGRVPLRLDRVDRLARNLHDGGQILLRKAAGRPKVSDLVFHDVKLPLHEASVKLALHTTNPTRGLERMEGSAS